MEYQPTATSSTYPAPPDQQQQEQQQLVSQQQQLVSQQQQQQKQPTITPTTSFPPPPLERPMSTPFAGTNIRTIKSACEISLGDYIELVKRQQQRYDDPKVQDVLRAQYGYVVSDLQTLRREVSNLVKEAESHRWRRWLLGGLVASFIPIVRKIFRRSAHDRESNDTEHAFKRSRSLVSRIMDTVRSGGGKFAAVASIVLAVLYVFQNEVSLRVARTVSKRLKRLTNKIERGEGDVVDKDLDVLNGWRWRVLLMQ